MNETMKTIMERYSCRDFAGTPLTEEQLKTLATAALAAPSGMNRQPWRIILLTDKQLIEEMDVEGMKVMATQDREMFERFVGRGGSLFYNAPCMVIVLTKTNALLDCGILTQNVALAAHSIGLGNVICGLTSIPLSGPRGSEFKERIGFGEDEVFAMSILVGQANSGKEPHQLDWSKVTFQ